MGLLGIFIPLSIKPLTFLISKLVTLSLFLIEKLCDITSLTGIGSVIIGKPAIILVILYYLLLFILVNSPEIPLFNKVSLMKKSVAFALGVSFW